MKLVTFECRKGIQRVGVKRGKYIIDLQAAQFPTDMRSFLAGGSALMQRAHEEAKRNRFQIPETEVKIKPPISNPEKIICVGLNYYDHAKECGMKIPKEPVLFSKYASSIIGPNDSIIKPKVSQELDYEVELVIVIGKEGKNIPLDTATNYVAGYTIGHDVSARDWQLKKDGGQWMAGKTFDTFAPIGPCIRTMTEGFEEDDDPFDPHNTPIQLSLNGKTVQQSNTNQLIFKTPDLISYISQVVTLKPGDLIFTGTPPGVGFARKPPLFMNAGDTVVCEIRGLGTLHNTVVAEK